MEKLSKLDFPNPWPLIWPFWPHQPFPILLESLAPKKTSGMQKYNIWELKPLEQCLNRIWYFGSQWAPTWKGVYWLKIAKKQVFAMMRTGVISILFCIYLDNWPASFSQIAYRFVKIEELKQKIIVDHQNLFCPEQFTYHYIKSCL